MFKPTRSSGSNLKHVSTSRFASALIALTVGLPLSFSANAVLLGPTPYLSSADSPFSPFTGFTYFHLENFEDGLLNTPGVVASTGGVAGPSPFTASVDADDGTIDGSGTGGSSFFTSVGGLGYSFTFDAGVLGTLPNSVGLVRTGDFGTIEFRVFDPANVEISGCSLGSTTLAPFTGDTADDRFLGCTNPTGISRIFISSFTTGGLQIDHLQYGLTGTAPAAAPEPSTLALLGLGLLGAAGFRRRRTPQ